MNKLIILLGLLAVLFVACAGCVSPDVPAVNNTTITDPIVGTCQSTQPAYVLLVLPLPPDPIVGTWQSTQTYTVNGKDVYLLYEIKDDNTGYALMADAGSSDAKKLDIFWGNDNGKYVFAYTTDTSTVYPHTLSADGKILTDAYGDTYTKI